MPLGIGNQSESCKATIVLLTALTVTGHNVYNVCEVIHSTKHFTNVHKVREHFINVEKRHNNNVCESFDRIERFTNARNHDEWNKANMHTNKTREGTEPTEH